MQLFILYRFVTLEIASSFYEKKNTRAHVFVAPSLFLRTLCEILCVCLKHSVAHKKSFLFELASSNNHNIESQFICEKAKARRVQAPAVLREQIGD